MRYDLIKDPDVVDAEEVRRRRAVTGMGMMVVVERMRIEQRNAALKQLQGYAMTSDGLPRVIIDMLELMKVRS